MKYFRFKSWREHQHYHDRNPPWIKLYVNILDPDGSWAGLDDRRRGQLANLLAYASRMDNVMPMDNDMISQEIGATSELKLIDFNDLIEIHENRASCYASESASKVASKDASENARPRVRVRVRVRDQNAEKEKNPCADAPRGEPKPEERIIDHLNTKTGKKFATSGPRAAASTDLIKARLKQGFTEAECIAVIDAKVREWTGTDWAKFLRPATLFNKTKFEGYVGDIGASQPALPPLFVEEHVDAQQR